MSRLKRNTRVFHQPRSLNQFLLQKRLSRRPSVTWVSEYSLRQKITLNSDGITLSGDLTNLTVAIQVDSSQTDFWGRGVTQGSHVRFTASDGVTRLNFQVESYDATGDDAWFHVQVPTLSSSVDTDIYIYYGNASPTDGENKEGTWDSSYSAVYHLNASQDNPVSTPEMDDATSNDNDGTDTGTADIAGQIDRARDFDGTADYISIANSTSLNNTFGASDSFTVECWFEINSDTRGILFGNYTNATTQAFVLEYHTTNTALRMFLTDGSSIQSEQTALDVFGNGWHHAVMVRDISGSRLILYVDGVEIVNEVLTEPGSFVNSGWKIGQDNRGTGAVDLDGEVDELTLSATARSLDWAKARNASGLGAWVTFGEKEYVGLHNDYSTDTHCVAVWYFEEGALTTDSQGTNTLTPINSPASDTTNFREGFGSVILVRADSDYYNLTGGVDSGFPLKSGEVNRTFSVFARVRMVTSPYGGDVLTKWDELLERRSLRTFIDTSTQKASLAIGYDSGQQSESVSHDTVLSDGVWYNITWTHDIADRTWWIRVRDEDGNTVGTDKTGQFTNTVHIASGEWKIGAHILTGGGGVGYFFDGNNDEVVVFNDVITAEQATQLAQGKYGSIAEVPSTRSLFLERDDSQYAVNTSPTNLVITGDMTIEVVIKPQSMASDNYMVSIGLDTETETGNVVYALLIDAVTGELAYRHEHSTGTNIYRPFTTQVETAKWQYIALVRDATAKTLDLHMNGSIDPTETETYSDNPTGGGTGDFYVGSLIDTAATFFDGLIYELRIWNDKRTGLEISRDYDKILVGDEAGLVGLWEFKETLLDKTSNDNDLTSQPSLPVYSTDIPLATNQLVSVIGVTDTTTNIHVRTHEAEGDVSILVQYKLTATAWGSASETTPIVVNADTDHTAVFTILSLTADTIYDYRVEYDDIVNLTTVSQFQTFPAEDSAVSFKFVYGADVGANGPPYTNFSSSNILAQSDIRFMAWLGDTGYVDSSGPTTFEEYNDAYYQDDVYAQISPYISQLHEEYYKDIVKRTPSFFVADDHEFENDWDEKKTGIWIPAVKSYYIYRASANPTSINSITGTAESGTTGTNLKDTGKFLAANVEVGDPVYNLTQRKITHVTVRVDDDNVTVSDSGYFAEGDSFIAPQIYYSFKYGDVEFFAIDNASYRDTMTDTDNSSKDLLGTRQKAWLKDAVKDSTAVFKVILSGNNWGAAASGSEGHNWSWDAYQTEMAEIWDYWAAAGTNGIIVLSGDLHQSVAWKALGTTPSVAPHNMEWFYDFCGGPLATGPIAGVDLNVADQLYRRAVARSYNVVTVDTTIGDPTFKVDSYEEGDSSTILNTTTVLLSASNGEPIIVGGLLLLGAGT